MWYVIRLLILVFCSSAAAIWPAPRAFENGSSVVWLASDIRVTFNGGILHWGVSTGEKLISQTKQDVEGQFSSGTAANPPILTSIAIIQGGIDRARKALLERNLVPWKLVPRNGLASLEPSTLAPKTYVKILEIVQTGTDTLGTFKPLAGEADESYNLTLGKDGAVKLSAVSSTGILRALETFVQLFYGHSSGSGIYTNLAPVKIIDSPTFEHRGLNMDVSRNWYPVQDILRTIDALSWNKFNRLHLHMTDSQSWPLDIPALPELSSKGAYQSGLSYTPLDLQNIQIFGLERGIEVIIEFDMPGHTTSIGLSHPDLIAAFNARPWSTYCAEPPCGSLKLNSSAVYDFLDTLFGDILPRVKPYSTYFHSGGDEINANTFLLDDTINSNDTQVLQPLIQKFIDHVHDRIRKAGLTPLVWEEIALDWNVTLGEDVVVQSWLSEASVAAITAKGHKALAGNYNYWYLDCGKGQWLNFENGAAYDTWYPFNDYCSPVKNWRLAYSYDPLGGVPKSQAHLVLGGEVHLWSEQTDAVNLDDMIWPRASAAGEVLWSGRQDASGRNRSQVAAAPRLAEMRERMVNRGTRAGPVQMIFCTQNEATECAL